MDLNPTIFTDKAEAERDACDRLLALQIAQALQEHLAQGKVIPEPHRLAFLDADGRVVLEVTLG